MEGFVECFLELNKPWEHSLRRFLLTLCGVGPWLLGLPGGATWFQLYPDVCGKVKDMGPFSALSE